MKSWVYRVVMAPDEDAWRAWIPELENRGGATWGKTPEEAMRNIHEVAQMVTESMLEEGEPLPPGIAQVDEPVVAVTV